MSLQLQFKHYCLIIGLGMAQLAHAGSSELLRSDTLTMASLMQKVYEQLPSRSGEAAYQQQVAASKGLAQSLFANPATVNLSVYNDEIGSGDGQQEWEGGVNMPLWLSGQQQQQRLLSDKFAAELPAYQQKLKLDASHQVRNLVWDVLQAETKMKQATIAWHSAEKLEQDVQSRVKAGELPTTAQILAHTNTIEMDSRSMQASSLLQTALKRYQFYTGVTALPKQATEALVAQPTITEHHPFLALLQQRVERLHSQLDLAKYQGAVNPELTLGMRHERGNRDENFNNSLNLGIRFAIDDSAYRAPAVAAASKVLADVQIKQRQLQQDLNSQLLIKLNALNNQQQQLSLLNEQEKSTQQYVALQQRAFDLGEINLVDLLRAQTKANESRSHKQSLQILIKRTIAEVNQIVGVIL